MQRKKNKHATFSSSEVTRGEIIRHILNLDISKTCQDTNIPSKIIKKSADIFASFSHASFITSVSYSEFHQY